MQTKNGDCDSGGRGCGTDFVVDFLFGYTGYDYRVITDAAAFKDEIAASIDAGKPIIVKLKPESRGFHLITGYDDDGDTLLCIDFIRQDWSTNPPTEKKEQPPDYGEIDCLYISGNKGTRRYTLKDGLENIRSVIAYQLKEGIWDEYLKKLGGWDAFPSDDGLDKADFEERKARGQILRETTGYVYNFCSFGGAFGCEHLPDHYLHKEFFDPALSEFWKDINEHWNLVDAGHRMGGTGGKLAGFWWNDQWNYAEESRIPQLSFEICEEIIDCKKADMGLLDIINEALAFLPMPDEQRQEAIRNKKAQKETRKEAEQREQETRCQALAAALEATPPRGRTADIDLTTMIKHENQNDGNMDVSYSDGLMTIKSHSMWHSVSTPQNFSAPLKIELRAKTDSTNIRVGFRSGGVIFNWEHNPNELRVHDIATGRENGYSDRGTVPVDEFVDIEWTIGRDVMIVKVNGELRHCGDGYRYIQRLKANPEFIPPSQVNLTTFAGATVTVESLRVTEM